MNRNKIIELAKKIKALAEKGKGGERNAAKEKLERICEKYNISPDEISTSDESKDYYIIINLALGGAFENQQSNIDHNALPAKYIIDYVRVYAPNNND